MTVDKKDMITIPKWLVIVLIPIILGGIGGYAASQFSAGRTGKEIEFHTKEIDLLTKQKVSREEFVMMRDQLNRIEGKLDNHISNK